MIDRLEWESWPGAEASRLAVRALYGEDDPGRLGALEITARGADLPFYPTLDLVHLTLQPATSPRLDLFVLANDENILVVDGTSQPIHRANKLDGVEITEQTAADYLRFFCFAVRGDAGPFLLFEEPAAAPAADDAPATAVAAMAMPIAMDDARDDSGRIVMRAVVAYDAALFRSVFAVSEDGATMMVDDDPLAQDIPARVLPRLPELAPAAVIVSRLESAGAVAMNGSAILRAMVELLLETALQEQAEVRLLAHFNARLEHGSPVERFARLVTTAAPVVCIESTLPFVEETVGQIVRDRAEPGRRVRWIRPDVDPHDDTRLRVSVQGSGPAVLLLPFHSYRSIVDAERVSHEMAANEIGCLIGCERAGVLPGSIRQVIDLTLTLARLTPDLFATMFRRVMRSELPPDWQAGDAHWVTHVHHSDFQQPQGLALTAEDALAYIRERATQRLRDVEPAAGLGLRDLHGLGEARAFAEDLIADIHEAVAGRLDWRHVDRGVLLVGAPGTGKTTVARAIAKDCGIRFVNASAASWQAAGYLGDHIRAMRADFALARRFAPAILFIDEIDSIGSRELFSGHNAQYATQVVNALLEQLQGMDPTAPVIVIAATNHRDRVDPALRRAGRLDREIEIPRPNTEALSQIYQHYLGEYAPHELAMDIDVHELGGLSLGRTGADIELFVRGAARRARKAGRTIGQADLIDEITSKPRDPDSSPRMTPDELHRVAVHEAGHALASYLSGSKGEQIGFVSIVPRADGALGFVANLASNRVLLTRTEYLENIEVVLAGRAAEEVVFGEQGISGGAGGGARTSDLAVATEGALRLVSQYGLGPEETLLWSASPGPSQLRQAEEILRAAYKSIMTKLWQHVDTLQKLADSLVEHQELTGAEIRTLLETEQANIAAQQGENRVVTHG